MHLRSVATAARQHQHHLPHVDDKAADNPQKRASMQRLSIGSDNSLKEAYSMAARGHVARKYVVEFIEREMTVRNSCKSLPFTFIFWIVFVCTSLAHRQVQLSYTIQSFTTSLLINPAVTYVANDASSVNSSRRLKAAGGAVSVNTERTTSDVGLNDVKTLRGVYDWIDSTIVSMTWTNAVNGASFISNFNRVVGGCRLQQTRLVVEECPGSSAMKDYFNPTCYSRSGEGILVDNTPWDTYWLDIQQNQSVVLEHTTHLRQTNWLSQHTDRVRVQQVLFNDQVALFAFVEVVFELRRSGQLTSEAKVKVVPTQVYDSTMTILGDVVLAVLLSWLAIGEILNIYELWQEGRKWDYLKEFHYKLLNWVLFVMGIGLVIFYVAMITKLDDLDKQLRDVPSPPLLEYSPGSDSWVDRHGKLDTLYSNMETAVEYLNYAEVTIFWYMLVVVFKFFQAFGANPRLALITRTFYKATADLIHFLIIFLSIFFNFAVGAFIMFGGQIEEWSNLTLCITTSFRALMGDFDFTSMYAVAPVSACIWFIIFMFLIFIVMLNMLLAIVMDIYCDVKGECSSEMSLFEQLVLLLKSFKFRRGNMKDVLSKLSSDGDDSEIDLQTLRNMGVNDAVARGFIDRLCEEILDKYAKKNDLTAAEAAKRWQGKVNVRKDDADKGQSDLRSAALNFSSSSDSADESSRAEVTAKDAVARLLALGPPGAAKTPKGSPAPLTIHPEDEGNSDNWTDIARTAQSLLQKFETLHKN